MSSVRKLTISFVLVLTAVLFAFSYKNADAFYINETDGYTYNAPKEFLVDESFLPDTVRFISTDTTVEIYVQPCKNRNEELSYINYTNKAITSDNVNYSNVKTVKKGTTTILMWSRKKLSRISNDKNHYIKIDIPHQRNVYTILVKSSKEQWDYEKYEQWITFTGIAKKKNTVYPVKKSADDNLNEETQAFYNNVFVNSDKVEWGIFQQDFIDQPMIYYIENNIGHKFNLLLQYTDILDWYDPFPVRNVLDKAYSEGRTVELTLQPPNGNYGENMLFSVLDGKYDEFLNTYAKEVAAFAHPVMFRFCNEMNGDWCEYSGYRMSLDTELYRELYKYVFDIFEKNNANNVIWIWNPNGKSFPDFKWNSERMYYPGNKYVDILGLTLYNTGTYYSGEKWVEFDALYRPLYDKMSKEYDMPFMITEFASARTGGNKEAWTERMLSSIGNYPKIKAAVWWNGADYTSTGKVARAYYINDSQGMVDAFKEYFATR